MVALFLSLAVALAPTADANGTTLPFQRHLVRVRGVLAAAVQQQGASGQGLTLFTSHDGGATWKQDQAIQPDWQVRDTADLIGDGANGFFLVYGVEPKSSRFGPYPKADVVALHYTLLPDGRFGADLGPLVVFHPKGIGQAYFRPSLARDQAGVLHCAATFFDGHRYSWWVKASTDGGAHWVAPEQLAAFGSSPGSGRVIAYGDRVGALFDDYDPAGKGQFRSTAAGATSAWTAPQLAVADGLYHGAAFSLVATADGRLHLGYSDKQTQQLHYRVYRLGSWSAPELIEPKGIWSNQPALTADGESISFAWNHSDGTSKYRIEQMTLTGAGWSAARTLDAAAGFKGYTSAIERAGPGERPLVLWSWQKALDQGGAIIEITAAP